jgi:heat shock protein HtpX
MRSRRELFPGDLALTARMLLAAVLTPAVLIAALVAVVLVAPGRLLFGLVLASAVGMWTIANERSAALTAGRTVSPADSPELHAIVERLCLLADLPKPRIVVEPEVQPNSWVVSVGRGRTSLHLTEGLLACLKPSELEAVVAHELAHVAHRDAMVMTVVGGPGTALLGGGTRVLRHGGTWFIWIGGLAAIAIGWLGSVGTRTLSRYREFAADAGAVRLTGNPAALASALMAVSEGLLALPERDLRSVAARDAFHLLPVSRGRTDYTPPLPPTHPSLQARIARLEHLEARLQSAR